MQNTEIREHNHHLTSHAGYMGLTGYWWEGKLSVTVCTLENAMQWGVKMHAMQCRGGHRHRLTECASR